MKELKELIERAILVAAYREGDVDTQDGAYATTDTDEMIHLESAIQDLFGLEAHELNESLNSGQIIEKKLNEFTGSVVAGMVADSLVITDAEGETVEFDWREGVVELKGRVSDSAQDWVSCSIENGDSDMPHDKADHYLVQLGDDEGFIDEPYIDYIDTCAETGFTWFANDTERMAKAYLPIFLPKK